MILVDANVVIASYHVAASIITARGSAASDPLETVDQVWDNLLRTGTVGTVNEVVKEVDKPPAQRWQAIVNNHRRAVLQPFEDYYLVVKELADWVYKNFEEQHAADFLRGADSHLIAMAVAAGHSIATLETMMPQRRNGKTGKFEGRVRLPFVAWKFRVPVKTLYDLFTAPAPR